MAGDIVNIKTSEVEAQRLGYTGISFSTWTGVTEPAINEGSKVEVSGSLYAFSADETIDNSSAWAGITNDRTVYIKLIPSGSTSIVSELTTNPGTWNEIKQGFYGTTGSTNATHRYIGSVYKDTDDGYSNKSIYISRNNIDNAENYKDVSYGHKRALYHIQDEKAQNTDGGTFTSGAWRTRDLNTEKTAEIVGASLGSNQITLPAGSYYIEWSGPANSVNFYTSKLYNITDAADIILGTAEYAPAAANAASRSLGCGRFTLAGSKVIELQFQCLTTKATSGLGVASNFQIEVYSIVKIWKVSD